MDIIGADCGRGEGRPMKTLIALALLSATDTSQTIPNVSQMSLTPPWLTVIEAGQNGPVWRCAGADTTSYLSTLQVLSPALCAQDRIFAKHRKALMHAGLTAALPAIRLRLLAERE